MAKQPKPGFGPRLPALPVGKKSGVANAKAPPALVAKAARRAPASMPTMLRKGGRVSKGSC